MLLLPLQSLLVEQQEHCIVKGPWKGAQLQHALPALPQQLLPADLTPAARPPRHCWL
jgi:hypothetical protein